MNEKFNQHESNRILTYSNISVKFQRDDDILKDINFQRFFFKENTKKFCISFCMLNYCELKYNFEIMTVSQAEVIIF